MALGDAFKPVGNYTLFSVQDFGHVRPLIVNVSQRPKQVVDITGPTSSGNHNQEQGNTITEFRITGYHGDDGSATAALFPASLSDKTVTIYLNNGTKFTGTADVGYVNAESDWRVGAATMVSLSLTITGALTQAAP